MALNQVVTVKARFRADRQQIIKLYNATHSERNDIRAAYNYAEHLPERRRMMQHWADYLDELKYGKSFNKKESDHENRCYTYADE